MFYYTDNVIKNITLSREREKFCPGRFGRFRAVPQSYTPFRSGERDRQRANNDHQRARRIASKRSGKAQARALRAVMPENAQCDLLISRSHCNATRYKIVGPVVVPND